jgi:hypothetical protein
MPGIAPEEAVLRARARINLAATTPVQVWPVRRLDRPDDSYYLVVFGENQAALGVVAVGAARGEIQTWANLPGLKAHLALQEREAIERAGLGGGETAELVWTPCRATRSPLYPLWEVRTATRVVYVDQQGIAWPEVSPGG